MNRFDLSAHTAAAYDRNILRDGRQPVIGITANYGEQTAKLAEGYYKRLIAEGATPVIIPPSANKAMLLTLLNRIDGLLLSGGADINPLFMGEEPQPQLGGINDERDLPELLITRLAFNRQMPILGICRGIQVMAVALGGRMAQHISTTIKHSQDAGRRVATHSVTIEPGSTLYDIYEGHGPFVPKDAPYPATLAVNSFHHQAVSDAGPHFRVSARAADGTIEAIESCEHKPFVGVQWHPECLDDPDLDCQPLFAWLANEAGLYRRAQQLHNQVLSLDTHCDTPMFFTQNVDFAKRDPRILVSLPKMYEGRLDATIMVSYLPQKQWHMENGTWVPVSTEGEFACSPRQYADNIFDQIEQIVSQNSDDVALARTPGELLLNKENGRKSIMLGIENGLALQGNISNVRHFARRGVVYITLCHNGDNDLCDSAKGEQTHGGVSDFGAKVIKQMNRYGVMVDLSHAHEKSFYDALDISKTPIVCSHSSCRALCDHPRNLTDEQMRALAKKGGVCQITAYPGFLRSDEKASIIDLMEHLDHAISIMGIDHVGLGTDFDGDGGVPGLADASELTNFTRQLLKKRYSSSDISKIWGGNFLRVMTQVQANQ